MKIHQSWWNCSGLLDALSGKSMWNDKWWAKFSFEFQLTMQLRLEGVPASCSFFIAMLVSTNVLPTSEKLLAASEFLWHKRVNSTKWRKEAKKLEKSHDFLSNLNSIDIFFSIFAGVRYDLWKKREKHDWIRSRSIERAKFLWKKKKMFVIQRGRLTNSSDMMTSDSGEQDEKTRKTFLCAPEKDSKDTKIPSERMKYLYLSSGVGGKISHENKWNFQHSAESN